MNNEVTQKIDRNTGGATYIALSSQPTSQQTLVFERLGSILQSMMNKNDRARSIAMLEAIADPVLAPIMELLVSTLIADKQAEVDLLLEKATGRKDYIESLTESFIKAKTEKGEPLHPELKAVETGRLITFAKFFAILKELRLDRTKAATSGGIKLEIMKRVPRIPDSMLEPLSSAILLWSRANERWLRSESVSKKITMAPQAILLALGRPGINNDVFMDRFGALLRSDTRVAEKIILLKRMFVAANWPALIDVEKQLGAGLDQPLALKFKRIFEAEFDRDIVNATCDSFSKALKGITDATANMRLKRCRNAIASNFNYSLFDRDVVQRLAGKVIPSAGKKLGIEQPPVREEKKRSSSLLWILLAVAGAALAGGGTYLYIRSRGGPEDNSGRNPSTTVGPLTRSNSGINHMFRW